MDNGMDKSMFFNNVKYLAKLKEIKIGELETGAGVSVGYISRTSKDSSTKPGMDFVVNVAKLLGYSLDSLVLRDMSKMSLTECRLISFIEKMIQDTMDDKLNWIRESSYDLNRLVTSDENGQCSHPLYDMYIFTNSDGSQEECPIFVSRSFETNTQVADECFHFYLKNGTAVYLMNVFDKRYRYNDADSVREIWMCTSSGDRQFVCFNKDANEEIARLVDNLYELVGKITMHPKFNKIVEDGIASLMDDSGVVETPEFDVLGFLNQ